ncbi:hypothetical protein [Arthrobacter sp. D3-16]
MTLEPAPGSRNPKARSTDALPRRWRQLLALSGFAFAVLLLLGWFLSGGNTPDYTATDEDWRTWAGEVGPRSGIGASLMLFGGVAFLLFVATIRRTLGSAEPAVRGSGTLGSAAFGGALVGIAGIGMALVNVASATSAGADADPVAIRAVATASAGAYLVAAMGFAAFLGAVGLSTLRSGSFPRWTGVVALVGAVAFLITFLTAVVGLGEDSVFGYGFLPGILALVVWSMATSIAQYRAVPTSTAGPAPREAEG